MLINNNKCILFLVVLCIFSENEKAFAEDDKILNENLSRKELIENSYSILLPNDYEIVVHDPQLDFVVYYINYNKITHGGIYFGNHPLEPEKYDNKVVTKKSIILGKVYEWDIYYFDKEYITEIIIDNTKNKGWDQKINLWIIGKSMEEVNNMLFYYSTLEKK
ncbi:hypothetical protein FACS1894172_11690 [Spirochaetia bacterium]|nr:hypothetical protein FACS1894164_18390 [Spirochaetia bacterium]GHU33354.1 hypothetical protein FACS1894172_11690 [Spirochaetia bacterium]